MSDTVTLDKIDNLSLFLYFLEPILLVKYHFTLPFYPRNLYLRVKPNFYQKIYGIIVTFFKKGNNLVFKKICVLGLGYIGLPTASTFATHGIKVVGIDINEQILNGLNNGQLHLYEPGLRTLVQNALHSGNLTVKDEPEDADAFVIAVPTPITKEKKADLSYVKAASKSITPHLKKGNLVVLESTSPPRTTLDIVAPILEESGLQAGKDFYLAYSPERVLPGKILREIIENTRVIGGINAVSAKAGKELYATFVTGEIILTNSSTAEMVKLMENTYRDINIAIANEFTRLADHFDIDIWEVIQLANRHPRVNILKPGPGVGGHCISVDPWFLVEAAPDISPLVRTARQVNDSQPAYVVNTIKKNMGELQGKHITALGLAYKPNVDDLRESPAIEVVKLLAKEGAITKTFEPYKPEASVKGTINCQSFKKAIQDAEIILLLVSHKQFLQLDPKTICLMTSAKTVIDTTGTWKREQWEQANFHFICLGQNKRP